MKVFDLIDSASFGYRSVWLERKYLLRLALVPVLINFVCTILIFVLDARENFLRQGLIMLPASLAQGWMLAQFLRTLILNERWPIAVKGQIAGIGLDRLLLRARGIISSMIAFALVGFAGYGARALMMNLYEGAIAAAKTDAPPPADGIGFILAFGLVFFVLSLYRFLWLYIPFVVLMPVRTYLQRTKGVAMLLQMLGVFMVTVLPLAMLTVGIIEKLTAGGESGDAGRFLSIILSVVAGTLTDLISTAAMVYLLRGILPKAPGALPEMESGR